MKRIILGALAVLLTSGALFSSRPAYACVANPLCQTDDDCYAFCINGGHCSTCAGKCLCFA